MDGTDAFGVDFAQGNGSAKSRLGICENTRSDGSLAIDVSLVDRETSDA